MKYRNLVMLSCSTEFALCHDAGGVARLQGGKEEGGGSRKRSASPTRVTFNGFNARSERAGERPDNGGGNVARICTLTAVSILEAATKKRDKKLDLFR